MDPTLFLAGKGIDALGMVGGRFLGNLAQPAPNISSATALGGNIAAPFNVGGGIGGAGQLGALTTGIAAWVPWLVIGVLAWAVLKK